MFEHFQAGNHVILTGMFRIPRQFLDGGLAIVHFHAGLQAMELGYRQWRLAHIDTGNMGAPQCHAFGQQPAAAANIQSPFTGQRYAFVDVIQPQRVDVVQWLELAGRVPPAAGERLEFGNLVLVYVLVVHVRGYSG